MRFLSLSLLLLLLPGPTLAAPVGVLLPTRIVISPIAQHPVDPRPPAPAATERFGFSVHTAGDVNGDGYSDFLVGSPGWDINLVLANAGRVFLFSGGNGGYHTTADWTVQSGVSGAQLGFCARTAGDVNGDGLDDVIVGAPYLTSGQAEQGRAYVYLGTTSGTWLQTAPVWTTTGSFANSNYGWSVSTAGDVNGDGYDDIIVGSPFFEGVGNPSNAGAWYVYHGSPTGPAATPAASLAGTVSSENLGYSVSTAGDVNADGYDDIIVGAPGARSSSNRVVGKAYVYYGSSSGVGLTPTVLQGSQEFGRQGESVHLAGDFNGDGYADVVVGQPNYDGVAGTDCGRAHVFPGGPGGVSTSAVWTAEGPNAEIEYGSAVATIGDFGGDSCPDLVIGAPHFVNSAELGAAFVVTGGPGASSYPGWRYSEGASTGDHLGMAVGPAGDVNNDGFSDILFGAPDGDGTLVDQGLVELWLGGPRNETFSIDGADGHTGQELGRGICHGDVNGDGFDDWMTNYGDGALVVNFGDEDLFPTIPDQIVPGTAGVGFANALGHAGDVNGDGYDDVIVGSPLDGPNDEGSFSVFYGSPSGLQTPAGTYYLHPDGQLTHFGFSVAGVGDYDGDGYSDIIVGGPLWAGGQGQVRVFRGSPDGLITGSFRLYQGSQAGMQLGYSVAGGGDWNADGFSDFVFGAPFFESGGNEIGIVGIYLGDDNAPIFAGSRNGQWDGAGFGKSLAILPDMNDNGYSEIVIGAPDRDFLPNIITNTGAIFIYDGADTSLAPKAITSLEHGERFGASVANAGDVNGDGLTELVVGSPGWTNTFNESETGRIQTWMGSRGAWWLDDPYLTDTGINPGDHYGATVSTAGDRNGDGFSDILMACPDYDNGPEVDVGFVSVNGGNFSGNGYFAHRPQFLGLDGAPIAWWGTTRNADRFTARLHGRSAGGRIPIALQVQVSEYDQDIGGGISFGLVDPGGPVGLEDEGVLFEEEIQGLAASTLHKVRMRVASRSPYFPHSPWFSAAPGVGNFPTFRTNDGVGVGVPEIAAGPSIGLRFDSLHPNPTRRRSTVQFSLERAHAVRVDVVDVTGRRVSTLADDVRPAGRHEVDWDGTDSDGQRVASGVYYVRVSAGALAEAKAVTIVR